MNGKNLLIYMYFNNMIDLWVLKHCSGRAFQTSEFNHVDHYCDPPQYFILTRLFLQ